MFLIRICVLLTFDKDLFNSCLNLWDSALYVALTHMA